jgi:hypothetical protein
MRKGNPDRAAVHQKFDIHGVGVAGSDGHDEGLIENMDLLLGPAVGSREVSKHKGLNHCSSNISSGGAGSKHPSVKKAASSTLAALAATFRA